MSFAIHPSVDDGTNSLSSNFSGGTLACHCSNNTVAISVTNQISYTHLCGCTQCWKPEHALFALISVVSRDKVSVINGQNKLKVINKHTAIWRHACKDCGVHMYGRIENKDHAFYGLDFIHPELFKELGWAQPQFAAFVSSIIESGTNPDDMVNIRTQLKAMRFDIYDCLSPELMDIIALNAAKSKGVR